MSYKNNLLQHTNHMTVLFWLNERNE
uniref:Uncharacterized protein n=1 Tax=Arundo donax TaxID=35708 RepID=A0A0A9C6A0_ARUDO